MFDYQSIIEDLTILHKAASVYNGWQKEQANTFIRVGEYGLALDSIAYAYLSNHVPMPSDSYQLFENLVSTMDLDNDPELQGVTNLNKNQRTPK